MLITLLVSSLIAFLLIIFGLAIYLVSILFDESDDERNALGLDSRDFASTPVASPNEPPIRVQDLEDHHQDALPQQQQQQQQQEEEEEEQQPPCSCASHERDSSQARQDRMLASMSDNEHSSTAGLTSRIISLDGTALLEVPPLVASKPSVVTGMENNITTNNIQMVDNRPLIDTSERQQRQVAPDPIEQEVALASREQAESSSRPATKGSDMNKATTESKDSKSRTTTRDKANEPSKETWWRESASVQRSRLMAMLDAAMGKQVLDDLDSREMQLGGSALHWCKTRATLDKLAKLGIPLNTTNKRKETALHVAVRRHKLQVLTGLLVLGADVECRNEYGETPLITASRVRNIFGVQLLLLFDANLDAIDDQGRSARHHVAIICEHSKANQRTAPSAAALILAMLNEIGAKRCPASPVNVAAAAAADSKTATASRIPKSMEQSRREKGRDCSVVGEKSSRGSTRIGSSASSGKQVCPTGCSHSGDYNGNSYNRWPNFKRESLYKRHMFNDIIAAKLTELRANQRSASSKRDTSRPKRSRLLCIDGGGLRGVIVCQILLEMEKYLKRPMVSYFDWIGGTSVGAFIACALCLGVPLKELRQICFDVKDEVFAGGRPYNSKFLERVLKRTFGETTRLSDIEHYKLAVTTVMADREPCQLRLFRNYVSPARLLEKYGYASDTFNNMSGHSVVGGHHHQPLRCARFSRPKSSSSLPVIKESKYEDAKDRQESGVAKTEQGAVADRGNNHGTSNDTRRTINGGNNAASRNKDIAPPTTNSSTQNQKLDESMRNSLNDGKDLIADSEISGNLSQQVTSQLEAVLDENDPDPIVWQAVRASSAAPFFFKPYGPYLDGGIISNNPTLDMLNEYESYKKVRKFLRKHLDTNDLPEEERQSFLKHTEPLGDMELVVSLGTGRGRVIGRQTMVDFGQVASGFATVFSPMELVRSIRAARDFFKKLMQQSCHTDDYILDRAQAWCSSLDTPYFRINPPLATIFSIDDRRDEQLINALWQTKLYMRSMKDQLGELAELLDGPSQK